MVVGISVKADVRACVASLNDIARKQLPYAVSAALNDVARQVQIAERANLQKVLKSPRPFTVNSVFYRKATKAVWVATVYIKDTTAKYLLPFEFGGVHVLPGPALLDPKNIKLDPYGQLRNKTPQRLEKNPRVFVGEVRGITGFWLRPTNAQRRAARAAGGPPPPLKLLIRFGIALPVKTHLNFHVVAVQVVKATFAAAFNKVMTTAVKKARKTP
jgi:hypothetical protein